MGFAGDTSMGSGAPDFRSTVWDCLRLLQGPESAETKTAFDQVVRWYWKPVYRAIRLGWNKSNEDAKDLTQAFFLTMFTREALAKADPARGKFRTLLKTAIRNFVSNEQRNSQAVKRGGEFTTLSLDFDDDPPAVPAPGSSPEEILDREWARVLLTTALDGLKEEMKGEREVHHRMFEACDLRGPGIPAPSHGELAAQFAMTEGEIKRSLHKTRDRLKEMVVREVRKYAQDETEVWEELESLMKLWSGPHGRA